MGHQVTIIDNIPHITPVKSRVGELLINVFERLTDQIDSNISPD